MPTIDFLPVANNPGAFVESQADYVTALAPAGRLVNGYPSGIVPKEEFNKTVRQSSMIAAAVATFIGDTDGLDVLDDGDLAALVLRLTSAIELVAANGAWGTGDLKLTLKNAADAGWILWDDGTVGDAASGATHASADNEDLFTLLWTNVSDTWAPVVTGRGGSAAADWAAHKKITLTKLLGRALAIAGAGSGLSVRALGQNLGEETHTLLIAEMPSHDHGGATGTENTGHTHGFGTSVGFPGAVVPIFTSAGAFTDQGALGSNARVTATDGENVAHVHSISAEGGGGAHNIMQPTGFLNVMVKV